MELVMCLTLLAMIVTFIGAVRHAHLKAAA